MTGAIMQSADAYSGDIWGKEKRGPGCVSVPTSAVAAATIPTAFTFEGRVAMRVDPDSTRPAKPVRQEPERELPNAIGEQGGKDDRFDAAVEPPLKKTDDLLHPLSPAKTGAVSHGSGAVS